MHENEVELGKRNKKKKKKKERKKKKKEKKKKEMQYLESRNWLQMLLWPLDLPSLKLSHWYVHRLKDAGT
jgi:hypothetical protein